MSYIVHSANLRRHVASVAIVYHVLFVSHRIVLYFVAFRIIAISYLKSAEYCSRDFSILNARMQQLPQINPYLSPSTCFGNVYS